MQVQGQKHKANTHKYKILNLPLLVSLGFFGSRRFPDPTNWLPTFFVCKEHLASFPLLSCTCRVGRKRRFNLVMKSLEKENTNRVGRTRFL